MSKKKENETSRRETRRDESICAPYNLSVLIVKTVCSVPKSQLHSVFCARSTTIIAVDSMSNEAIEYHSKDFEWDKLRQEIENDPSLVYHLLPFEDGIDNHNPSSPSLHLQDSDAWNKFHTRHSTGKFFKVIYINLFSDLMRWVLFLIFNSWDLRYWCWNC